MTVEIRRGTARFVEREAGRQTRHAFSFGSDYDPERVSFGPLVCHDDHLLGPGTGFDSHRHSDLEIVTWVVSGALRHVDSWGGESVVRTGSVAVLSTGSADAGGVEHSEHATDDGPCRFVQMWLRPGEGRAAASDEHGPGYVVAPVDLPANRPVPIAQPRLDAVLWAVRLDGTASLPVELPTAPSVYAFVVTGALLRSSLAQPLAAGDAFAMTDEPAHTVAAGVPTDLLVWTFHDGVGADAAERRRRGCDVLVGHDGRPDARAAARRRRGGLRDAAGGSVAADG